MDIKKHYNYYEHVIEALKKTGGSATPQDIKDEAYQKILKNAEENKSKI